MEMTLANTLFISGIAALAYLAYNKPHQGFLISAIVGGILLLCLFAVEAYSFGYTTGSADMISQVIDKNPNALKTVPRIEENTPVKQNDLLIYLIAVGIIMTYAIYNEPEEKQSVSTTDE